MLVTMKAKSIVPQSAGTRVAASSSPGEPINLVVLDLIDLIDQTAWDGGIESGKRINRIWKRAHDTVGRTVKWESRAGLCGGCGLPALGNFRGGEHYVSQSESVFRGRYADLPHPPVGWAWRRRGSDIYELAEGLTLFVTCSNCGKSMTYKEYAADTLATANSKNTFKK